MRFTKAALFTLAFVVALVAAEPLPNFIIIYIDDMGYADIGPFGAKGYSTPALDRMAEEGRVFTDFYATQAVCSASRAGLMTGCYNVRVSILGALNHTADYGISSGEMTLAELVKQKGYATACYGKWHLGHHPKFLPTNHGFDEYFGLPYSNDMWPHRFWGGNRYPDLPLMEGLRVVNPNVLADGQSQLTTWYTEHAVRFIEKNKDRPFLIYLPHSMVHVPLHVSDKFRGKSGAGLFGDVVEEVDWSVGQILDTLRKNNLDRQTMVIFSTDNGPWLSYGNHAGSALPLREGKATNFDGGTRVPTVMWWPGKIPAGTVAKEPAMTIDILPTIASLIGANLPSHPIDGKNIWPLVSGEEGATSPHEAFYFYWERELQAVRMGDWKLHFPHTYPTLAGKPGGKDGRPGRYEIEKIGQSLFNLREDIGETHDVAAEHPEVVQQITKLADRIRAELGDSATQANGSGVRDAGQLLPGDPRFHWTPGKPVEVEATVDKAALAVVEKVAGQVGFYSASGLRLGGAKVGTHPHEIVFSPDRKLLYVTDNGILWMTEAGEGGNTISIIDATTYQKVGVIDLGEYRRPHGMDIDPKTGRLLVTIENPDGLLLVDPVARKVLRKYDVQGTDPHMVLLDAQGEWAYVSNTATSTVAAVNIESGEVKLIPTDARPQGGVRSHDGKLIYLTNSDGNSISIIDTEKKERVGIIATGKGPGRVALTPDGQRLVYNLQPGEAVGFSDVASRKEIKTIPLGGRPLSLTMSADGKTAYAGVQDQDKVFVISVDKMEIIQTIETPKGAGPDPALPLD